MKSLLQPELASTVTPLTISQQRPNIPHSKPQNTFFSLAMESDLKERFSFKGKGEVNPITQDGVEIKNKYCFSETLYKGPDSVNGVLKGTSEVPAWKSSQKKIEKENSLSSLENQRRQLKAVESHQRNPITQGEFIGSKQFIRRGEMQVSNSYQKYASDRTKLPSEKASKVSQHVTLGKSKNNGSSVRDLLSYKAPNE